MAVIEDHKLAAVQPFAFTSWNSNPIEINPITMTILVPLDFSTRSTNALEYAATMAASSHGTLRLVHVLSPFMPGQNSGVNNPIRKEEAEFKLHILQEILRSDYGLQSTFHVLEGFVPDEILGLAKTLHPSLIAMASCGVSTPSSAILGCNTAAVMEKSPVPVMAIPPGCRYARPSRIVFGTENEEPDIARLKALISFANLKDALIDVVHVVNRFGDDEDDTVSLHVADFRNALRQSISYPHIHCEEYQHTDVAEGILCFVEEENADMLVLSASNRGLVERLVRGNLNNEYAYQLEVPLLCLHDGALDMETP